MLSKGGKEVKPIALQVLDFGHRDQPAPTKNTVFLRGEEEGGDEMRRDD
jgi:hypothetical protein